MWKIGSSASVTHWRQIVIWWWNSYWSRIPGKFGEKINRSMKTPWQEYSGVACSHSSAPACCKLQAVPACICSRSQWTAVFLHLTVHERLSIDTTVCLECEHDHCLSLEPNHFWAITSNAKQVLVKLREGIYLLSFLRDELPSLTFRNASSPLLPLMFTHVISELTLRFFFALLNQCSRHPIGLLQQTITWYKIRHAGGQTHYYSRTGTLKQRDVNQWSWRTRRSFSELPRGIIESWKKGGWGLKPFHLIKFLLFLSVV